MFHDSNFINIMFYAIIIDPSSSQNADQAEKLLFEDIKEASAALRKIQGSRMKTFESREDAEAFINSNQLDLSISLANLSIKSESQSETSESGDSVKSTSEEFRSAKPAQLSDLRRKIEAGKYEEVELMIWENPRHLVAISDSATYLMAGPKYNACHIAARADKSDIMALILDTISNPSFMKKLYPEEPDDNVQDRVKHLVDSYLNTPDPKLGNTPLHFACKKGYYRVVRVLLTFEECDLTLRDSKGLTAEESIDEQFEPNSTEWKKIKDMFKRQLHLPLYRDQLKKKLALAKRRASSNYDSDKSFSDMDDSFSSLKI